MHPYDDTDLIALARTRGLLSPRAALPRVPNWKGQLALALVHAGLLGKDAIQPLLSEIQRYPQRCASCSARFCAMPAARRSRRVRCPGCGCCWALSPAEGGLSAEALTSSSGSVGAIEVTRVGQTRKAGVDATVRDRTARDGRAHTSSLHPSWPGASRYRPGGSSGLGPVAGSPTELAAGDTIGDYIVLHEVSRGAMGVVFKARHAGLEERFVAIKVMQAQLADAEDLERFEREGQALAKLDHPNVVRVHELSLTKDGRPYLALDYIEGQTLQSLCDEDPLPAAEAAALLADVARGVEHINSHKIVHRDLKLSNVLLASDGRPIIADFGLVHLQDRNTRLTDAGDILGTPLYVPPEVILRDDEGYDARVDVYALGVMAYRMIVGRYPYYSKQPHELFEKIVQADLTFPDDLALDVEAVISQAMAAEACDRYPTAMALAEDLLALAAGRPVAARLLSKDEQLRRWVTRNPRMAIGLPLLLAAFVLLTLGGMLALKTMAKSDLLDDLEELAQTLDAFGETLERADDPDRAREQLDRHLRRARGALERGRELRGEKARAASARLEQLVAHLEGRRARAEAMAAAAAISTPLEGSALVAVREAFREAPPAAPNEAPARPFAEQSAWISLALGDAASAREILAPVCAAEDESTGQIASTNTPPGRRAWTLAWAYARARDWTKAHTMSESLPAARRAELLLFEASCATTPPARSRSIEAAKLLLTGDSPEVSWLKLYARFVARDPGKRSRLLALLREVRPFSDPPRIEAEPKAIQARARAVEGALCRELGWHAAAAEAYARARQLAPREVVRGVRVSGPIGDMILSQEAVAALGEARARARLLDAEGALEAARSARLRLVGTPAATLAAGLLEVEALDLGGDYASAEALQAELDGLAIAGSESPLATARARRRILRGATRGPSAPELDDVARAYSAAGESELAAFRGARGLELAQKLPAHHLQRAERAFKLALATSGAEAGVAWAGLARAALLGADLEGAAAALGRVEVRDDSPWRLLLARGMVRAATSEPGASEDLLRAAAAVGDEAERRFLDRADLQLSILREGLAELEKAQAREEVFKLRRRVSELAEEVPFAPRVRQAAHDALLEIADERDDAEARAVAVERRERTIEAARVLRSHHAVIVKADRKEGLSLLDREAIEAATEGLRLNPTDGSGYEGYFVKFVGQRPKGFDAMVLAFELNAHSAFVQMVSDTERLLAKNSSDTWIVETFSSSLLQVVEGNPRLETLPHPRDDLLRDGLAALRNQIQGSVLTPQQALRGLDAAEDYARQHPRKLAGPALAGVMRVFLGDPAGALVLLERAATLPPAFAPKRWTSKRRYVNYYEARAFGQLRRFERAVELLGHARAITWPGLIDHQPDFCLDRDDLGTLPGPFKEFRDGIVERELRDRFHD